MADKKLSISADLKVKTNDAERTLKKLEKEGIKISQILKGLDINTRGGRAGFAKSLATASKEMLKLRGTTGDTAKTMEHLWGRQIEKQTKSVDNYTRKIERLNKIFKIHQHNYEFQTAVGNTSQAAFARGRADKAARLVAIAEAARQGTVSNLDELRGGDGRETDARKRDRAMLAAAITQAVAGMGAQFAGFLQQGKTAELQNVAKVGSFSGGIMRRIAAGNYQDAAFLARGVGRGVNGNTDFQNATGQGLIKTGTFLSGVGQIAGGTLGALQAGAPGVGGGAGGAGAGMMTDKFANTRNAANTAPLLIQAGQNAWNVNMRGGAEALEADTQSQLLAAGRAIDPYLQMRMENLQQTAAGRLAASRRLGGKHQGLAAFGAGYGYTQDQAFGIGIGLADRFGASGGLAAARSGMAHSIQGFDAGVVGNIVGQMNMAGGDKRGEELLSRIIGKGTKQGLEQVNIQFFEKIGSAVAEGAIGQGGNVGKGGNFAEAMMFGLNKNSTMADVMGNISGQKALNGALHNNNFFRAAGFGVASKVLGKGASGLTVSALQSASLQELMSGSEELSDLGIGVGQRKAMLAGRLDAVTRSMLTNKTPEGRALLAGQKKYGSMAKFLAADPHARKLMAATLKETLPGEFGDYKTAIGAVDFIAGTTSGRSSGSFGSMQDGLAFKQIQTQSKIMQKMWADEARNRELLITAMNKSLETFDKLKELPAGLESAEKAAAALNDVYAALANIATVGNKAGQVIRQERRHTFTPPPLPR